MIGRFCEVKSDQKALRRRRHVEPVSIQPRDNKLRSVQKFLKAKSEASRNREQLESVWRRHVEYPPSG